MQDFNFTTCKFYKQLHVQYNLYVYTILENALEAIGIIHTSKAEDHDILGWGHLPFS